MRETVVGTEARLWTSWSLLRARSTLSPAVPALLLAALALRVALLPLGNGNDFRASATLALATLQGHDIYGLSDHYIHRHLHSLTWTYLPLCLHLFTALTYLAVHTGWPFRVLGKLPMVAADLAVGLLLYAALRRRGHSERVALLGMCLYLFNPLVLYNGAFYGRFDTIALAFLLLALEYYDTRLFAPAYALAIAAKTFPIFLLPLLALGRDRQRPRRLALSVLLVLVLSLPYIVIDPLGLFSYAVANSVHPLVNIAQLGRLSWYRLLYDYHWMTIDQIALLARITSVLCVAALLAFAHRPLYVKAAACFMLFVLLNRTLYEQYLLWPLPFLIILGLHGRSRAALAVAALYTIAGVLENENTWPTRYPIRYHLVPTPWLQLNVALAVTTALVLGALWLSRGELDVGPTASLGRRSEQT
jgi:hypothetical protein